MYSAPQKLPDALLGGRDATCPKLRFLYKGREFPKSPCCVCLATAPCGISSGARKHKECDSSATSGPWSSSSKTRRRNCSTIFCLRTLILATGAACISTAAADSKSPSTSTLLRKPAHFLLQRPSS